MKKKKKMTKAKRNNIEKKQRNRKKRDRKRRWLKLMAKSVKLKRKRELHEKIMEMIAAHKNGEIEAQDEQEMATNDEEE